MPREEFLLKLFFFATLAVLFLISHRRFHTVRQSAFLLYSDCRFFIRSVGDSLVSAFTCRTDAAFDFWVLVLFVRLVVCVGDRHEGIHLHARGRDSPQLLFPFAFLPLIFHAAWYSGGSITSFPLLYLWVTFSRLESQLALCVSMLELECLEIIITSPTLRSLKVSQLCWVIAIPQTCPQPPSLRTPQHSNHYFSYQKCPLPSIPF